MKTLKYDDLDMVERKKFLEGIVDKIIVKTKDKEPHSLDIIFQSPFVDDTLKWNSKGNPKKGYKVIGGKNNISIEMDTSDKQKKR